MFQNTHAAFTIRILTFESQTATYTKNEAIMQFVKNRRTILVSLFFLNHYFTIFIQKKICFQAPMLS